MKKANKATIPKEEEEAEAAEDTEEEVNIEAEVKATEEEAEVVSEEVCSRLDMRHKVSRASSQRLSSERSCLCIKLTKFLFSHTFFFCKDQKILKKPQNFKKLKMKKKNDKILGIYLKEATKF